MGSMNRTKHNKVLSVLEKRAMRYRDKTTYSEKGNLFSDRLDNIDETGTVEMAGLMDGDSFDSEMEEEHQLA